jgi:hypothetical protein
MKDQLVLQSAEPLENSMLKWRKLYWITLLFVILAFVNSAFWVFALLYLVVCYTVLYYVIQAKRRALRKVQFRFVSGVSYDDVFSKLQPALLSKYGSGFMIERSKNSGITVSYDGIIYDVVLEQGYFRLPWRMSVGKAIFSFREYAIYRKILVGMGIIGYELQTAYTIR